MIVAIDANTFNNNYVMFQETKINNMIDGNFTKFFYSSNCMSMTGVYIKFPLTVKELFNTHDKKNVRFTVTQKNIEMRNAICEIEKNILNLFKVYLNNKKLPLFIIKEQLNSGIIKITTDHRNIYNTVCAKPRRHNFTYTHLPLKKQSNQQELYNYSKTKERYNKSVSYNPDLNKYNTHFNPTSNPNPNPIKKTYIIKISGIWENSTSYGLTYKIIEEN